MEKQKTNWWLEVVKVILAAIMGALSGGAVAA